jgi:hypothetical protein
VRSGGDRTQHAEVGHRCPRYDDRLVFVPQTVRIVVAIFTVYDGAVAFAGNLPMSNGIRFGNDLANVVPVKTVIFRDREGHRLQPHTMHITGLVVHPAIYDVSGSLIRARAVSPKP